MKHLLSLTLAAAALAACTDGTVLVEQVAPEAPTPITFETYAPKMTRTADNSTAIEKNGLAGYHDTFNVWGKKTVGSTTTDIFTQNTVSYTNSAWVTDVTRFWDKAATYSFYAAAPADTKWTYNNGNLSYNNLKLPGTSLPVATGEIDPAASFKDDNNQYGLDLMIAHDVTGHTDYNNPVPLEFDHCCSRFNITVKSTLPAAGTEYPNISLGSIKLCNYFKSGNFDESHATADHTGKIVRWTLLGTEEYNEADNIGYTNATGLALSTTKQIVYQALVIPQKMELEDMPLTGPGYAVAAASARPYFVITYTVHYDANTSEDVTYYYNIAHAFGVTQNNSPRKLGGGGGGASGGATQPSQGIYFYEGWMNTLNITISPTTIQFNPEVYQWASGTSGDITML